MEILSVSLENTFNFHLSITHECPLVVIEFDRCKLKFGNFITLRLPQLNFWLNIV